MGSKLVSGEEAWLDCGNKEATIDRNKYYFNFMENKRFLSQSSRINNTVMIEPAYLSNYIEIDNAVIGPYVTKGDFSKIIESRIQNSVIQKESLIKNANLANSMLGNFVTFENKATDLSIGDYNTISKF